MSSTAANPNYLEACDVRVHFGGVKAIDGIDLRLNRDEILGLIGPNGAGKTTLMNVLSGHQKPTNGSVMLNGSSIMGWAPHRISRAGLSRTFQDVRLFANLTVLENIELGAVGIGTPRKRAREEAWSLIEGMGLTRLATVRANALPYGDERRVGILRALATRPSFLLLDEPAAGLDDDETAELLIAVARIPSTFDCGLLVIEHDMKFVMGLCRRIQVIDHGKTICLGTPSEVRSDEQVITAYLGSRGATRH